MVSSTYSEWLFYAFILTIVSKYQKISFKWLLSKVRSYFVFLPVMLILYVFFSIWLSAQTLSESVYTGSLAMTKFFSLIILMTIYIEKSQNGNFLNSIRSLWVRTGLSWQWIDHSFIFLYLIFRFYPAIQLEWDSTQRAHAAVCLPVRRSKWGMVVDILNNVPVLIVLYLRKSDIMAQVMIKRGYGSHFPRGMADKIDFRFNHLFAIVLTVVFFMGVNAIAQV